jgi:hypothetical protein
VVEKRIPLANETHQDEMNNGIRGVIGHHAYSMALYGRQLSRTMCPTQLEAAIVNNWC